MSARVMARTVSYYGLAVTPGAFVLRCMVRNALRRSAPEAASSLGIGVDALKSRLHRAREALRMALRPMLEPTSASAPSGCPDVDLLWSRKLEGDLSQGDCSAMEQHLINCPACGAACDALKRALLACQRVRTDEVPPDIQARVKAAVRAWSAQAGSRSREPLRRENGS